MNMFKAAKSVPIMGAAIVGTAFLAATPVQAENKIPEDLLSYDLAMRCSALHGYFAISNEDDKKQEKIHDDLATRWLVLAMVRDGEDGDKAQKELAPLMLDLLDRVEKMADDETAKKAFFDKGTATCAEWQEASQAQFDAVELD